MRLQTWANIVICLLDHAYEAPFANIRMKCQTWLEMSLLIGEVWNLVCCHDNKTVKLMLWSTFSRILLQRMKHFWYNMVEISFFYHIWPKFSLVYDVITGLICIFQKLEYLWNEKIYLKIVNSIFLLIQATSLCFKMASIGKVRSSS